jgi:hypothetical protein
MQAASLDVRGVGCPDPLRPGWTSIPTWGVDGGEVRGDPLHLRAASSRAESGRGPDSSTPVSTTPATTVMFVGSSMPGIARHGRSDDVTTLGTTNDPGPSAARRPPVDNLVPTWPTIGNGGRKKRPHPATAPPVGPRSGCPGLPSGARRRLLLLVVPPRERKGQIHAAELVAVQCAEPSQDLIAVLGQQHPHRARISRMGGPSN